jgi:hypothetical protein
MSLTFEQSIALYKIYPNATHTVGNEAFDANGNQVQYDINAVNTEIENQQAAEAQAQQTAEAHRQSAIAKLSALGLSADEINALGVK